MRASHRHECASPADEREDHRADGEATALAQERCPVGDGRHPVPTARPGPVVVKSMREKERERTAEQQPGHGPQTPAGTCG